MAAPKAQKSLKTFVTERLPHVGWPQAQKVMDLASQGATVPFMARYRKEATGNLDEVQIRGVLDLAKEYEEIIKRQAFVLKEIKEQGNLTEELKKRLQNSWDLSQVEELYRPFKQKKKTKATLAREGGLEPFAHWIWELGQGKTSVEPLSGASEPSEPTPQVISLEVKAKEFINPAARFVTYEEVIGGAQHILVEKLAHHPDLREKVWQAYFNEGWLESKPGKKLKPKSKFETYLDHREKLSSLMEKKNSHRYLAMRRGWKEGELSLSLTTPREEELIRSFESFANPAQNPMVKSFLQRVAQTALTAHVTPSIANEVHKKLKTLADGFAIEVFAENVKKLLLGSPFGARCVLGVDPGLRTGCKVVCVNSQGQFISHTVLKIQGERAEAKAKELFSQVLKEIKIEAVAVGNGTGGREAELFIRKVLGEIGEAGQNIPVVLVNESGASIYSASEVAREEFPDLDITIRGAISIARRLQDPLAELVKIEPKSIGVGQYQHDLSQSLLKKRLDSVVEDCVNFVGVNVNTASPYLLQHVAGIGPGIANSIVKFRQEKGLFKRRDDLIQVPHFNSNSYEQAVGFLRIVDGEVPLDATGVHPERYAAVYDMAKELGETKVTSLFGGQAQKILPLKEKWSELIGEYTFQDILTELEKPGRDPRDMFKVFRFREDIFAVKDLKKGMICHGIVSNVTNFGAFVDIGVHQDGLVHISEMAGAFVESPQQRLSPGDQIQVQVKSFDVEKNQISLTMKFGEKTRAPRKTKASAQGQTSRRGSDQGKTSHKGKGSDQGRTSGKGQKRVSLKGQGGSSGSGGRGQRKRGSSQPFNNPFAALEGLKNQKG